MYKLKRLREGAIVTLLAVVLLVSNMTALFAAVPENEIIAAISVDGNSAVAESTILAAIQTKTGDKVNAEAIKKDMQAIIDLGYFFEVTTDFSMQENGVKVTYKVIENPAIKEIVIKGNSAVPTAKINDIFKNVNGSVLNSKVLSQTVRQLEGYYHDKGYILAKVSDVTMNAQGVLTISISEGLLEGIEVKGNEKTKDYVITREMNVKPGEAFNVKDARRSMQKVYNLGYFEDVNMKLNPGKELNGVVLQTEVKEQKTGTFSIGGGYSSADGLVGFVEVGDTNFRGNGDQVKIHYEFGGEASANNYNLGFTRPWLDKKQTSIGFNIYDMTKEKDEYDDNDNKTAIFDERRKGWNVTVGRPHGEYLKNYLTYKDETVSNAGTVTGSPGEPDLDNFKTTHSITLQSIWDTRDNVFNATEGHRIALTTELAGGPLGGQSDFQKYQIDARKYVKVDNQHVWAFRVGAGASTGNLPESEEFSVGGSNSLRGYDEGKFEGTQMVTASAEYRFPLGGKVQGVGFVDAGDAAGDSSDASYRDKLELKASVGVGVRVTTPIGPIRLDYGVGEDGGKFHFSIGSSF
jgi:outer membrane protein insertion porin family